MRSTVLRPTVFALIGVIGVMVLPLADGAQGAEPAVPAAAAAVTVSGSQLLRGGVPWTPQGFVMIGALSPNHSGVAGTAHDHLNDAEMRAARSWGADSLRFQVSQRGLDPQDTLYGGTRYLAEIQAAVDLAAGYGIDAILSVQDQSLGGGTSHPQPSAATLRAWGTLTAAFNRRPDVIYEMFNEPQNNDDAAGWRVWRDGGPAQGNQGDPAVGHQAVLNSIRSTGSTNVVIADGARKAGSLLGVPRLADPTGQLAYGVHPYLTGSSLSASGWAAKFGYLTSSVPVIATEWSAPSTSSICRSDWPQLSVQLLDYLVAHRIGLYGWAFDYVNSLVKDWAWTPTSFVRFRCGTPGGGPGELIRSRFQGVVTTTSTTSTSTTTTTTVPNRPPPPFGGPWPTIWKRW